MRIIKYQIDLRMNPDDVYPVPCWAQEPYPVDDPAVIERVEENSIDGTYIIEEVPEPEDPPTQLDTIEAQLTYTAMMTDTLLEG